MTKLVLIDGNAILHRAYHALPKTLTTRVGEPINAVYGFVSMLLRIIADLEPTHIAVTFDRKEPTFRHKEFEAYQAHRPEMDKELSTQFDKAKKVISSFGIPIYEKVGFEADDIIGTLARRATQSRKVEEWKSKSKRKTQALPLSRSPALMDEVVIVTGDKDILQLVDKRVKVYLPIKGLSQAKLFGEEEIVEKLGVTPKQVVTYKALVGDPSDNYPGVSGIGPKTAGKLIKKYKSFKNIYKHLDEIDESTRKKLKESKEDADMSYKLAKIVTDMDIEIDWKDMDDWGMGREEALKVFGEFGFKTLSKRVKKLAEKEERKNQLKLV